MPGAADLAVSSLPKSSISEIIVAHDFVRYLYKSTFMHRYGVMEFLPRAYELFLVFFDSEVSDGSSPSHLRSHLFRIGNQLIRK